MKTCASCKTQNQDSAKFCQHCGKPLDTSNSPDEAEDDKTAQSSLPEHQVHRSTDKQDDKHTPITAQFPAVQPAPASASPAYVPQVIAPTTVAGTIPARKQHWKAAIIAVISVVIIALLVSSIAVGAYRQGMNSDPGKSQVAASKPHSQSKSQAEAPAKNTPRKTATHAFNAEAFGDILSQYSSSDVTVALSGNNGENSYSSPNSNAQFVAAGLYLPVYIAAEDSGDRLAMQDATDMMQTMSNDAANRAIQEMGGLSVVNASLIGHHIQNTDLQRQYGDTTASAAGFENYTSAQDATTMLARLVHEGEENLMTYDIADDGVTIPAGMTVHAHRGQGLQNSYNYFLNVDNGGKTTSIVVMTQNQDRSSVVQLVDAVLTELSQTA